MKKYLLGAMILICALFLVSWGDTGHRAVAKIAENHLTPEAKLAIKNLIGSETLPDISNYADELRSDKEFKYTAPWHFANLPLGLTFEQFSTQVKTMHEDNIYKATLQFERELKDPDKSRGQKAMALKFIVHFIGDMHQPMHISRSEDRGGNSISVTFLNSDANLHGLWDYGLIDHQGLNYKQMATTYDTATPEQIKKWQSDDMMVWMWESYQVATILYQEAAQNSTFGEDYYKEHLPVLQSRIEKGGIRLAGVLNAIFAGSK